MLFTVYVPDDFADQVPATAYTSLSGVEKMIADALKAAEIPGSVEAKRE